MRLKKAKEFDYPAHLREHPPGPDKIRRGPKERTRRREASKERITIRIDRDVLEQFKQLVPRGRGYQSVINRALREWLAARGVKELVREELSELTHKAVTAIRLAAKAGN